MSNDPTQIYVPPKVLSQDSKLRNDPHHMWRSESGIELIHREPDLAELERIHGNWHLMTPEQKKISDEKSRELFGMTNMEHYEKLKPLYVNGVSNLTKRAMAYKKSYELPEINKGDEILVGKYKNVRATVNGKSKDESGQPTLLTNKGERHVHPFRLQKLMPKK
jgi:hypothetical protein